MANAANKRTYYKRVLPSPPAIAFSSAEGRVIFSEALRLGSMVGFFKLIEQFTTQEEPQYCGLAALAMTLNALSVDPRRLWKGSWRWFSETMLDCCKSMEDVKRDGLTLSQAACLARCNGADVSIHRHGTFDAEDFRRTLREVCACEDRHMVVSYSRKTFKQSGDGHFSPVGGYHSERDLVLLLDVARFKYAPHWVRTTDLIDAMGLHDPVIARPRGFLLLSCRHPRESALFTVTMIPTSNPALIHTPPRLPCPASATVTATSSAPAATHPAAAAAPLSVPPPLLRLSELHEQQQPRQQQQEASHSPTPAPQPAWSGALRFLSHDAPALLRRLVPAAGSGLTEGVQASGDEAAGRAAATDTAVREGAGADGLGCGVCSSGGIVTPHAPTVIPSVESLVASLVAAAPLDSVCALLSRRPTLAAVGEVRSGPCCGCTATYGGGGCTGSGGSSVLAPCNSGCGGGRGSLVTGLMTAWAAAAVMGGPAAAQAQCCDGGSGDAITFATNSIAAAAADGSSGSSIAASVPVATAAAAAATSSINGAIQCCLTAARASPPPPAEAAAAAAAAADFELLTSASTATMMGESPPASMGFLQQMSGSMPGMPNPSLCMPKLQSTSSACSIASASDVGSLGSSLGSSSSSSEWGGARSSDCSSAGSLQSSSSWVFCITGCKARMPNCNNNNSSSGSNIVSNSSSNGGNSTSDAGACSSGACSIIINNNDGVKNASTGYCASGTRICNHGSSSSCCHGEPLEHHCVPPQVQALMLDELRFTHMYQLVSYCLRRQRGCPHGRAPDLDAFMRPAGTKKQPPPPAAQLQPAAESGALGPPQHMQHAPAPRAAPGTASGTMSASAGSNTADLSAGADAAAGGAAGAAGAAAAPAPANGGGEGGVPERFRPSSGSSSNSNNSNSDAATEACGCGDLGLPELAAEKLTLLLLTLPGASELWPQLPPPPPTTTPAAAAALSPPPQQQQQQQLPGVSSPFKAAALGTRLVPTDADTDALNTVATNVAVTGFTQSETAEEEQHAAARTGAAGSGGCNTTRIVTTTSTGNGDRGGVVCGRPFCRRCGRRRRVGGG
ncbi:hypothetical protein Agub_g5484, partial [Astrephomene gubernaculifera]